MSSPPPHPKTRPDSETLRGSSSIDLRTLSTFKTPPGACKLSVFPPLLSISYHHPGNTCALCSVKLDLASSPLFSAGIPLIFSRCNSSRSIAALPPLTRKQTAIITALVFRSSPAAHRQAPYPVSPVSPTGPLRHGTYTHLHKIELNKIKLLLPYVYCAPMPHSPCKFGHSASSPPLSVQELLRPASARHHVSSSARHKAQVRSRYQLRSLPDRRNKGGRGGATWEQTSREAIVVAPVSPKKKVVKGTGKPQRCRQKEAPLAVKPPPSLRSYFKIMEQVHRVRGRKP